MVANRSLISNKKFPPPPPIYSIYVLFCPQYIVYIPCRALFLIKTIVLIYAESVFRTNSGSPRGSRNKRGKQLISEHRLPCRQSRYNRKLDYVHSEGAELSEYNTHK